MSDQLLKLKDQILKDSPNVTSSQESVDGVMHYSLQDGHQIDLFGQDHLRANHSVQQGKEKERKTSDTFGLASSSSSESVNLQQFLENRLHQQLDTNGSMIYKLTWRQKVTPQQWQYCQLAASALRTNEKDYSSYPTPTVSESTHHYTGWNKNGTRKRALKLTGVVRALDSTMENFDKSQLNPRFSLWLMGFPIEWGYCGEQVMPLSRKSQQK